MAIRDINVLKSWFRTGFYPTQEQFWDWMDSYIHKNEGIGFDDVEGLVEYLNNRNKEILKEVNGLLANAMQLIQLERRIPLIMEGNSFEMFIGEAMSIYKIEAVNVASLQIYEEDVAIETDISAKSLVKFDVVRQLTDSTAYLFIYARAKVL